MTNPTPIENQILDLARQHGLSISSTPTDLKAEAITRLADDELPTEQARIALIHLRQVGVITQQQGHAWLMRLIEETDDTKAAQ